MVYLLNGKKSHLHNKGIDLDKPFFHNIWVMSMRYIKSTIWYGLYSLFSTNIIYDWRSLYYSMFIFISSNFRNFARIWISIFLVGIFELVRFIFTPTNWLFLVFLLFWAFLVWFPILQVCNYFCFLFAECWRDRGRSIPDYVLLHASSQAWNSTGCTCGYRIRLCETPQIHDGTQAKNALYWHLNRGILSNWT